MSSQYQDPFTPKLCFRWFPLSNNLFRVQFVEKIPSGRASAILTEVNAIGETPIVAPRFNGWNPKMALYPTELLRLDFLPGGGA